MARSLFGGRVGDTVASLYNLGNRQVFTLPVDANGDPSSVTLQVWDAVDGTQLTDLLAADGTTPITVVTVPSTGQVPEFYGPDGVNVAVYVKDPDDDFYRLDARADDAAQVAADAAAAAEAAQAAAEAVGNTNDTIMAAVAADPESDFYAVQSASIEAGADDRIPVTGGDYFAPVGAPSLIAAGRKWGFLGDSITDGSSAAAGRRYVTVMPGLVGTAFMAPPPPFTPVSGAVYSVEAGVPGERSDQILARVDAVIAEGVHGLTLMAGTNDAAQDIPVATYMTNVAAIAAKARKAGIPLVVGLVPPRDTKVSLVTAYNLALREWAARSGIRLADTHSPLVDKADGTLAATYDSGDGIHPNTEGHRLIAKAFATVCAGVVVTRGHIVTAKTPLSLVRNALFQTDLSTWAEQPGGTGTAPTYNRVADTTGKLPAGAYWQEMDFDGTASGGLRSRITNLNSAAAWAPGDKLLLSYVMEIEDVAGFAAAAQADPNTASVKAQFVNGSTGLAIDSGAGTPVLSESPGQVLRVFEVPAGLTSLVLWITVNIPTGAHVKVRWSASDVLNLTTAGLAGTF